ncbi:MAG: substrate-binding domain-containing protein, partial [Propionibacteriaceae bacterium]|nr:substrate-binding domain-containing protein [Propionibacteriaceae bacterium]
RSRRLGVLIDAPEQYGPNSALHGFEEAARELGYGVDAAMVSDSLDASAGIEHLLAHGVEGVCVIAPRLASLASVHAAGEDLPIVVVASEAEPGRPTVAVDQRTGARLAVEYLVGLGHREILHLAGPLDWLDARARESEWRAVLSEHGLPIREPVEGDWTADTGYRYGSQSEEVLGATAIFTSNDQIALGLLHGLHDRGIRVPEDISVVGFDDIPESAHFVPPLTTVSQDFRALGRLSVELLLEGLRGATADRSELIAPELVVRQSTAAPRW